ncbi:WLM domain [Geosmithia morbida]|uniref:WLM domain n=1 Tax=Geosmithia morbida TaxID=1094350 RepID=A0A9P5D2J0_9HYPO|nr:WLM domain [Geosmithia morbida]KAF4119554.1 WLM domain [Geosmithia morbida]
MSDLESLDGATSPHSVVKIDIKHRSNNHSYEFPETATVTDLFEMIEEKLQIPVGNQKILVPKAPMLQFPPKNPDQSLRDLEGKKLMLMGSAASTADEVRVMGKKMEERRVESMRRRQQRRAAAAAAPAARKTTPTTTETQYTFQEVRPLPMLPRPERSMALLMRLKSDPGIVSAMRKHKFSVGLLTEMEPLSHTQSNHEGTSRILGLNRNRGEVIELRLRTDAYDGYRDYKTIRKTLCHELAHNVHSDHDRHFWDLCHQIEREVDAADWKTGGRTIGETSRYHITGQADEDDDEDAHYDEGGWTGGEFVLGGVAGASAGTDAMSRRDILARAATERQRRDIESERKADEGWRPCQRPPKNDGAQ